MIEMAKLDDDTYVPKECCSYTNPLTSSGKREVDDVDMPCGADCGGEYSECVIQKIMNEYEALKGQFNWRLGEAVKMCKHKWIHFETRYVYKDNYPGSSQFKRIDRFFCENCCEEKVVEKSCYDHEDRRPEWFDFKNYQRIER